MVTRVLNTVNDMEPNINVFLQNVENENDQLHASLEDSTTESRRLQYENKLLKHELDKQKAFHRNFAEEVTATETLRSEEFNRAQQELIETNRSLNNLNSKLVKEVEFYKSAMEESTHDQSMSSIFVDTLRSKITSLEKDLEKQNNFHRKYVQEADANESVRKRDLQKEKRELKNENASFKKLNRTLLDDVGFYKKALESSSQGLTSQSLALSYSLPSKIINEKKLFEENKKLKLKILELTSIVASLKKKNKEQESLVKKIDNKRLKFEKDSEELKQLVQTNKDTYIPEVLNMLLNLAKNKK